MRPTTAEMLEEVHSESTPVIVGDWVRTTKWPLLVTVVLVGALYATNFAKLCLNWWTDETYSHSFLVPVAFFWMLCQRRKFLANAKVSPRSWGIGIVVLSLLQLAAGTWGAENFIAHSSLLLLLCGIALFLLGSEVFGLVAFPIAWLVFMIPLPSIISYSIIFPRRFLKMSVRSCCILVFAAVPIALGMNAARVASTGLAGSYVGQRSAEGFFHTFSEWLLFIGSLGLMLVVAQTLGRFDQRTTEGAA